MNNEWLKEIETAKLPKLARGNHYSAQQQQAMMPRKMVMEPLDDMDFRFDDEPPTTTHVKIKQVPVGEVQLCAMEMVAFMEGEVHSDRPQCVCPKLSEIMRDINDGLADVERNRMLPYLPLCVGTRDDGFKEIRTKMWRAFKMRVDRRELYWYLVEPFLESLFKLGKPTSFTKPERIKELRELVND